VHFRLASYNIAKGTTQFSRRVRIVDVKNAVHRLEADVVCLQEVQNRNDRLASARTDYPAAQQMELLAGTHFDHSVYAANKHYGHGHHGNAVLARFPVLEHRNVDLSTRSIERRGALIATLQVGGRAVHVVSTHFSLLARDRLLQARALAGTLAQTIPLSDPLIIAGDFNDWHRKVDEVLRAELGVHEAFDHSHTLPARTFPSFMPLLRLDRIYLRGVKARHAQALVGIAWAKRSDHVPIMAELSL
jgi:endonuclease/exonuclease/phosphatase family metal-dependent hydrolase